MSTEFVCAWKKILSVEKLNAVVLSTCEVLDVFLVFFFLSVDCCSCYLLNCSADELLSNENSEQDFLIIRNGAVRPAVLKWWSRTASINLQKWGS